MIPKQILDKHIRQAVEKVERDKVPPKRNSVHYDLVVNGKTYPPKLIISLATKVATGKEYAASDFNAVEAKNYFRSKGYQIIDRRVDKNLKPKSHQLIMDLVREAGVDVSDWANYQGGAARAASNPRYCYEWAFVEPKKLVVLSLWFKNLEVVSGNIQQRINCRDLVKRIANKKGSSVLSARTLRMDKAVQTAVQEKLPVRVIIDEGEIRDLADPNSKASKVNRRMLDPIPWAVTYYNFQTGDCIVKRGAQPTRFVDQFSAEDYVGKSGSRIVTGKVRERDAEVRRRVLSRADGRCEYCGEVGFLTHDGRTFLETHHVIPLSEDGVDSTTNVVALCPNHHREVHHGNEREYLRRAMLYKLNRILKRKINK